jgi:hypothetical protein
LIVSEGSTALVSGTGRHARAAPPPPGGAWVQDPARASAAAAPINLEMRIDPPVG